MGQFGNPDGLIVGANVGEKVGANELLIVGIADGLVEGKNVGVGHAR